MHLLFLFSEKENMQVNVYDSDLKTRIQKRLSIPMFLSIFVTSFHFRQKLLQWTNRKNIK